MAERELDRPSRVLVTAGAMPFGRAVKRRKMSHPRPSATAPCGLSCVRLEAPPSILVRRRYDGESSIVRVCNIAPTALGGGAGLVWVPTAMLVGGSVRSRSEIGPTRGRMWVSKCDGSCRARRPAARSRPDGPGSRRANPRTRLVECASVSTDGLREFTPLYGAVNSTRRQARQGSHLRRAQEDRLLFARAH